MDRRGILKLGGAAALSGCAASRPITFAAVPPPPVWKPEEVDSILADMDATLAKLAAAKPDPARLGLRGLDQARVARDTDLTMRTLAAMHVAATFRELPTDVLGREDVQRRMLRAVPFIDDAMLDMAEYLASVSSAERRAIRERLRKDPSAGMEGIGKLDEHAKAMGIPNRRRMQMRAIATHASWRMTHQSVDALLDDTLDKVQRVRERHGRDEQLQRALAAKITEAELFGEAPSHLVFATGVPAPPKKHHAATVLGVGAVLLGLGGVFAGIGAVVVSSPAANNGGGYGPSGTWMAGAFSITVGALLGLAGIIVLIVGAVMASNEADQASPESEESVPDLSPTWSPPPPPPSPPPPPPASSPPPEPNEGD